MNTPEHSYTSAQSFDARADAAAAADDTLLELGDIDSPPARADVEDDFVLDFDDEPRPFVPQSARSYQGSSFGGASYSSHDNSSYAEQSAGAAAYPPPAAYQQPSYDEQSYAEPSYEEPLLSEDAPSAVEMQSAGSVSMAEPEPSVVWDAAQEFTASPDAITEPVQAPAWEEPEARATTHDDADAHATHDAATTRAPREEATTGAARDAAATSHARESEPQPASQTGAQLSHESVEAIARRVVELMSDRAVREIAWEVVPDLAERLIRQKLEEERARQ